MSTRSSDARKPFGRRIAIGAAVAVASVLLTFALVETGLALFAPVEDLYLYRYRDGVLFNRGGFDNLFSPVPLHWARKLKPEQRAFLPLKERVRTNSRGERDDREPAYARGDARLRVLNLGDSIGFGWPVALEDTYLKVLEKALPGTETINCAIIGSPTAELLPLYVRNCSRFETDVVLLQVTIDRWARPPDFPGGDWLGPDHRIAKVLRHVTAQEAPALVERDILGVPRLRAEFVEREAARIERAFEPRLPLYRVLHAARFIENLSLGPGDNGMLSSDLADVLRIAGTSQTDPRRDPDGFAGPTLRNILVLKELVARRGARLLVLMVPTSFRLRSLQTEPRPDVQALKVALERSGVWLVDAADRIDASRVNELYYQGDRHPNAQGYRFLGQLLAETIANGESGARPR